MDMDRKATYTSILRNAAWGQFAAVTAAFVLYALMGFFAHLATSMALNVFLPRAVGAWQLQSNCCVRPSQTARIGATTAPPAPKRLDKSEELCYNAIKQLER